MPSVHWSSGASIAIGRLPPALFTRMSTCPNASRAALAIRCGPSSATKSGSKETGSPITLDLAREAGEKLRVPGGGNPPDALRSQRLDDGAPEPLARARDQRRLAVQT